METVIIRRSRSKSLGIVLVTGTFILSYFIGPLKETRKEYVQDSWIIYVLGFILFLFFLYNLVKLLLQPAEITLSDEGIELKSKGINYWMYIDSFSTLVTMNKEEYAEEYYPASEYLIIKLRDTTELECAINNLDKSREEIISLIKAFNPEAVFIQHGIDKTN